MVSKNLGIAEVTNKKDLKKFVFFPETLYQDDPYWIPPLWMDEIKSFHKEHNPILINSDFGLLLAYDKNRIVGRNLVYIDHKFNEYYGSKIGFFGAFECIENMTVARALMDKSEEWLKTRGMSFIRGPIHPIAESWGFLKEGFNSSPVFMAPYNFPYYNDYIVNLDYIKVKDLLAYEANVREGYQIPERFRLFSEKILSRKQSITVRRINPKKLIDEAENIWAIANIALKDNWGYVPVDRGVMEDMIKKLKGILDMDAVWFVEDSGKPVGFALGYPDPNVLFKKIRGRLFPFGFIKVLIGIKKVHQYRLIALAILPEYQNLGFDVLLYTNLFNALSPKRIRLEVNYILEDNIKIRNAIEKLNLKPIKTYRIYEKILT